MGFLDKLGKVLTKSATSPKVAKTVEAKAKKGVVTLTGTIEGRSKTVEKGAPNPKLISTNWHNDIKQTKFGKETILNIKTSEAMTGISSKLVCYALVIISDIDSKKVIETKVLDIARDGYTIKLDEQITYFRFMPKMELFSNPNAETYSISAEVFLFHMPQYTKLSERERSNSFCVEQLSAYLRNEKMPYSIYNAGYYPEAFGESKKTEKLEISKIVIVIDPGHGYDNAFCGTVCRHFKYYLKDEQGNKDKNRTKIAIASKLPDYVLNNIKDWIVSWVDPVYRNEEEKRKDYPNNEWFYVIDISLFLKQELEKTSEFIVLLTRELDIEPEDRDKILGEDIYGKRREVANKNKADYFISLHCDGQNDFKLSGAFVVIPRDKDSNTKGNDVIVSRRFGEHLMKHYKVIAPLYAKNKGSVVQLGEEKSIIISSNKTQRRVIVELGRMTNPNDILKLYEQGAKKKIAQQLAAGIVYDIESSNY